MHTSATRSGGFAYDLFQLDGELGQWLVSSEGRFEQYYAERNRPD